MWYLDILKSSMSIMRKIDCRKENHETSRDEKYMKKYNVRNATFTDWYQKVQH